MMIQPQIDFCCFRLVAINIALTHCYKLVSCLNLIITKELIRVMQSQLYNYYWGTSIIVVHLLIESLGIRVYFY